MNKKRLVAAIGAVVLITLTIAVPLTTRSICANETVLVPRPESWAQPIEMEGVPNLYKLSDDLYRSAQPSAEGMANLEEMGIKTIINLRSFNSDRDEIEGTDLGYEQHLHESMARRRGGRSGVPADSLGPRPRSRACPLQSRFRPHRYHVRRVPRRRAGLEQRGSYHGDDTGRIRFQ